jgi:hypothetical protein
MYSDYAKIVRDRRLALVANIHNEKKSNINVLAEYDVMITQEFKSKIFNHIMLVIDKYKHEEVIFEFQGIENKTLELVRMELLERLQDK